MATSITLQEVAELMRDAIKNDSTLAAFCTGTLGAALSIQVGSNPQQPLGATNSPYCIIVPISKGLGDTMTHGWTFTIAFGNEEDTFEDYQSKGAKEMKGIYLIEQLGDKIMDAVNTLQKNYTITSQNTNIDADEFPLQQGTHILTLTAPNVVSGILTIGG